MFITIVCAWNEQKAIKIITINESLLCMLVPLGIKEIKII